MGEITRKVYEFICEYTRVHGAPPSYAQISNAFGLSRSSVSRHIMYLEGRELLYRPGKPHTSIVMREANTDWAIAALEKHQAASE